MNEHDWLACDDPGEMLGWMGYRLTDRQARLFAVACCRRIEEPFANERMRRFIEVAQRFAEGQATRKERLATEIEAYHVYADNSPHGANVLVHGLLPPVEAWPDVAVALALSHTPAQAYLYAYDPDKSLSAERAAQARLLRDILGWPMRLVLIHPTWLTPTVRGLAEAVADDEDFGRLPILADALEDAGCTDELILGHCRDRALEHVRGCWVVHQILGPR